MVQPDANEEWKRFIFLIDVKIGEQGKILHRTAVTNNGVHNWDIIMIMETWLKKKKREEMSKIEDNLPD
ncbi:MAG: hypothetical protein EPN86_02570 [Nanoarchaeota archaeon]|nr:MAG: hypothetical protein EPN86_02570 [Nanoarchaeota archaeon]